jgi:hypothetical protein
VSGWKATLVPEARGLEAVAKQIKVSAQTYPLFDLAGLILDKPERYRVKFERQGPTSSPLVQCLADETLWLNEKEAVAHVLKQQLEHFYQCERVTVEPPKGAYPVVAQCGVSGVLLGPPNYHDYQAKLRQLYTQKFAHLPFDVYKSRIQMVRDEAAVQKWKDEQSSKDEFQPRHLPEGAEPVKLGSLAEVEAHFRQNHAATAFATVGDSVSVAGPAATHGSTPAVVRLVQRTGEELRRHLLPLAQAVGQDLSSRGLQIFKAHENITYVSIARPRHLDRTSTPVSTLVLQMLEYLEAHRSIPRADQWKGLVTLRPLAEGSTETEREAAVLADLKWLLQEGHVVDYARRGLEVVRGPKPKPEAKKVVKEEEATNQTSPGAEQTQVPETKTVVIATKAEKPEVQPALAVEPEAPAVLTKSSAPDSTTPSV